MNDLLLSIVTVTKNCISTIDKTLDSVAAVKQSGVEYIVVDGLSIDGTVSAIQARGELVDRIVSEPDTGIYNAMNKGVALASGHYVLFINGDDELVAQGFPSAMEEIARCASGIICATTLVGNLENPEEILVARPWCLPFFNSIPHPSSFIKRQLLIQKPFREDMRIVSDYDFFLGAYQAGQSFRVLPVVTALHQRGGVSGDVQRSQAELERVRRERLGWRYPLIDAVAALYRQCKRVILHGRVV